MNWDLNINITQSFWNKNENNIISPESWSKKLIVVKEYFIFTFIHRLDGLNSEYQQYVIILVRKREQYHILWKLISSKKTNCSRRIYYIYSLIYFGLTVWTLISKIKLSFWCKNEKEKLLMLTRSKESNFSWSRWIIIRNTSFSQWSPDVKIKLSFWK